MLEIVSQRVSVIRNARQQMNGWDLLRALDDECARLAIFDPQYRAVLDAMKFGNEKTTARQQRRAALSAMTDNDIQLFVEQIERVLKPSGYLALWVDKFIIGSGHHLRYLEYCSQMRTVDLLCWETQRFGMGRRFRSATEYLLILQKDPKAAKGTWHNNSLRDWHSEKSDRDSHPHAKPEKLTRALIETMTRKGDLVVDPCAGSFGVLSACRLTGREFVGCDLASEIG